MITEANLYRFWLGGSCCDHTERWYRHEQAGMNESALRTMLWQAWPGVQEALCAGSYVADEHGGVSMWPALLAAAGFIEVFSQAEFNQDGEESYFHPPLGDEAIRTVAFREMERHIKGEAWKPPVPNLVPPDVSFFHQPGVDLEPYRRRFHELERIRDTVTIAAEQVEGVAPVYRCGECGVRRDQREPRHNCPIIQELEMIQGNWPRDIAPL